MKPMQKPYPELWYGTSRPDSIPWAAERGAHIVTLRDNAAARAIIDLYKEEWRKRGRAEADLPKMGINRHLVVADTEAAAPQGDGRRGYRPWRRNMERLVGGLRRAVSAEGLTARGMGRVAGARPRDRRHAGAGFATMSPRRSRPPARPISSAISRSARSPMTKRCARSSCSPPK